MQWHNMVFKRKSCYSSYSDEVTTLNMDSLLSPMMLRSQCIWYVIFGYAFLVSNYLLILINIDTLIKLLIIFILRRWIRQIHIMYKGYRF